MTVDSEGPRPEQQACRLGIRILGVHGYRFRRHRHEPPLYPAGRHQGSERERSDHARGGDGHRVADLLVLDHRHLDQVRHPDHASRQPRRGRHPGPSGVGEPASRQGEQTACGHGRRGSHRRDAALWRRHDHAGDFGAERNRRHQAVRAPSGAIRHSADGHHPGAAVRHSAQRHIVDRRHIRSGHADLVRRHRDSGNCGNCQGTLDPRRLKSVARDHVPAPRGVVVLGGDRGCLSRSDGRRGVLCGHGPLRAVSDPCRLVRRGAAGVDAQLFRPGRPASQRSQRDREFLLSAGSGMGALRHRRTCHPGDRHRLPVDHFGGVFADAPGHSTRIPAAAEHRSYGRTRNRPNLRSVRELGAGAGNADGGDRFRIFRGAGGSVWNRGLVADGHYHPAGHVRRTAVEAQSAHRYSA